MDRSEYLRMLVQTCRPNASMPVLNFRHSDREVLDRFGQVAFDLKSGQWMFQHHYPRGLQSPQSPRFTVRTAARPATDWRLVGGLFLFGALAILAVR